MRRLCMLSLPSSVIPKSYKTGVAICVSTTPHCWKPYCCILRFLRTCIWRSTIYWQTPRYVVTLCHTGRHQGTLSHCATLADTKVCCHTVLHCRYQGILSHWQIPRYAVTLADTKTCGCTMPFIWWLFRASWKKQEVAAAMQVVPAATQEVAAEMQEEPVPVLDV